MGWQDDIQELFNLGEVEVPSKLPSWRAIARHREKAEKVKAGEDPMQFVVVVKDIILAKWGLSGAALEQLDRVLMMPVIEEKDKILAGAGDAQTNAGGAE